MFPNLFLTGNVGSGQSRANDVVRIRKALHETGYGRSPQNPSQVYDSSIRSNIMGFQKDFGLKPDGFLAPGGPTELAMSTAIAAKRAGGTEGLEALRAPFAALTRQNFSFVPDPQNRRADNPRWVDADGNEVPDHRRDAILEEARRHGDIKSIRINAFTAEADPLAGLASRVLGESMIERTPNLVTNRSKDTNTTQVNNLAASSTTPTPGTAAPSTATPPASGRKPVIGVPAYRKEVIGQQGQVWQIWTQSVNRLPKLSPTEERAYMEIFAAEGGVTQHKGTSTWSGIEQDTLDELIAKRFLRNIKPGTTPKSLSIEQRAEVYRAYFDFALSLAKGSATLTRIGDPEATAAFADALFRHGRTGGARLIQQAINRVARTKVGTTGPAGEQTVRAFAGLAAAPKSRRLLLDALGDERWDKVKNSPNAKGELIRINHFRFQKSP